MIKAWVVHYSNGRVLVEWQVYYGSFDVEQDARSASGGSAFQNKPGDKWISRRHFTHEVTSDEEGIAWIAAQGMTYQSSRKPHQPRSRPLSSFDLTKKYREGASATSPSHVRKRDRSAALRSERLALACAENHGHPYCMFCGRGWFGNDDFGVYEMSFWEIAHITMAIAKGERESTLLDVSPACPNCHTLYDKDSRMHTPADVRTFVETYE